MVTHAKISVSEHLNQLKTTAVLHHNLQPFCNELQPNKIYYGQASWCISRLFDFSSERLETMTWSGGFVLQTFSQVGRYGPSQYELVCYFYCTLDIWQLQARTNTCAQVFLTIMPADVK